MTLTALLAEHAALRLSGNGRRGPPDNTPLATLPGLTLFVPYDTGKTLANGVRKAMTNSMRTNCLDDDGKLLMRIISMRPTTLPIVYPRTPGNLTEWSINFELFHAKLQRERVTTQSAAGADQANQNEPFCMGLLCAGSGHVDSGD